MTNLSVDSMFFATVVLVFSTFLQGCADTPPSKSSEPKSIKQIADEAMNSKGKLSKEQINALIVANSKCSAKDH